MARCDTCSNDYDKTFTVTKDGRSYAFDSIECAAQLIAPTCPHCHCRILGHGVEDGGAIYCCASCARQMGRDSLQDRAEASGAGAARQRPI